MSLLVRAATVADAAAIHSMIRELAEYEREPTAVVATAADLEAALFTAEQSKTTGPAAHAHVAELDGEVVGFALWFLNYSTWLGRHGIYLEDLYVRPAARGAGAGSALLRELARICVERGYGRLEWSVLDWNQPSIDFYLTRGAVAMDEWTTYRLTGQALAGFANGA